MVLTQSQMDEVEAEYQRYLKLDADTQKEWVRYLQREVYGDKVPFSVLWHAKSQTNPAGTNSPGALEESSRLECFLL
eukprot:Skav202725  [mRNA]  locus=scaffold1326:58253:60198:- [translate_table: standard]